MQTCAHTHICVHALCQPLCNSSHKRGCLFSPLDFWFAGTYDISSWHTRIVLRCEDSQPLATLQECGKPAVSRFRRMRVVLSQRFYGDLLFSIIEPIADKSQSCGALCQNASVGFIPGRGFQSQWCYLINNEYIKKPLQQFRQEKLWTKARRLTERTRWNQEILWFGGAENQSGSWGAGEMWREGKGLFVQCEITRAYTCAEEKS